MNHSESLLLAETEIKPYLIIFKGCYERAIIRYNKLLDAYEEPMYNRTKAVNFHNIIVNEIKRAFIEVKEAAIVEKYESISLVIDNHISARFKKFNYKGLPSNHKSNRNDALIGQQLEIGYVDYPPIARVDIGHNFDISGTKYDTLKIICRKNNQILWELYFNDAAENNNIQQNPILNPDKPPTKTPGWRVTPTEETKEKKSK